MNTFTHYLSNIKPQIKLLALLILGWNLGAFLRFIAGYAGIEYSWPAIIGYCLVYIFLGAFLRYKKWV